jgi:hypothetical protein
MDLQATQHVVRIFQFACFVACCLLPAALPAACGLLPISCGLLPVACCLLRAAYCLLLTGITV